ncbi:ABC-type branched-subunit amino acid transport system substrate-binding protein [Streptomyces aurantiacus]|uniref:ABC transporter substrate-binding protein n=1 Tax=Streptomyces aurantiacus TaxID=47760 RepID=UPI00279396E9|nr:ABC transporter substrate-binding protein [Streptomyces aurantiacus]MDQ0775402.1 ABC-type branched-subunit amino acid transport system substrate-binding protein [Streptomyces aurantiacus]
MTGRRDTRTALPATRLPGTEPKAKAKANAKVRVLSAGALALCLSTAVGCGVVPGTTGGSGGDDTVTVMTWAPEKTRTTNKPGMPAMAKTYARWVNDHGGINGRKLKVLTCNDHNDTVAAANCARRAVEENVVAVVGSYSQHARSFFSPLEAAGIPYLGGYGVTDDEFTSPLSYPVNGGQPSLLAGLGRQLARTCGPVTLIRPDTIAGDELPVLLDSGLTAGGHPAAVDQRAAEDATEYLGHAKRALQRASTDAREEGCVIPALGDRTDTFMDSFRRAREDYPTVRTASVLGSVDQSMVDATGSTYEGAYVTGWYPAASDERWQPMRDVIQEEAFGDNRIDVADPGVQTTWIAYTALRKAIESLGDGEVSARSLRRTLDDGLKIDTGGLTPTLSWSFQDLITASGFPRLVNADVTFQVVRKGKLATERKGFANMSKVLETTQTP